jgi:transposase-like protein
MKKELEKDMNNISIHPTIDVCGKKNLDPINLSTTSKLDVSDLKKDFVLGSNPIFYYKKKDISRLLEKYEDYPIKTTINMPCPFCLRSHLVYYASYTKKLTNQKVRVYQCKNCNKFHSLVKYVDSRLPDDIVDYFIDIIKDNNYLTRIRIIDLIYDKFNIKLSKSTITLLIQRYNKGKLFPYYIKNSKFNKIHRNRFGLNYYPHIRKITKIRNNKKLEFYIQYDKNRLSKSLEKLKDHNGKIISSKIIRELQGYTSKIKIADTILYTHGYLKRVRLGYYLFSLYKEFQYYDFMKN